MNKLRALPEGWEWKRVEEVIEKVPLTGKKLKQSDYQEVGKLPVIDQGQSFIGGYTDNEDLKVCCELPVVIFGDHTKAIKYVDFDFVAGADGIQVMKPQKVFNPKFFYYFIRAIQLPDKGYARHFQLLEKSQIPLPPLPTQRRIVSLLEKAEETKRLRAQADELTDRLLQSVFLEMFGDPVKNPKGWDIVSLEDVSTLITKGESPLWQGDSYKKSGVPLIRTKNVRDGHIVLDDAVYVEKNVHERMKRSQLKKDDLLFSIAGTLGRCGIVLDNAIPGNINQDVALIRPDKSRINPLFANYLLATDFVQRQITCNITGATRSHFNLPRVRALHIILPPVSFQQKFAHVVEKIESMRQSQNQSKQQIEDLFSALMQKAFRGEI